jgi:hypothetical protein
MAETLGGGGPRKAPLVYRATRRFVRLPGWRRVLLLRSVLWLAWARFSLVFMPFNRLAAWFGTVTPPSGDDGSHAAVLGEDQIQFVRQVSWAVTRAARYVPFRAVCLPQAIAAFAILKHRGYASTMHFGVRKRPGQRLEAHAWLDAGGIEVTGYPVGEGFVEMARFL